MPDTLLKYVANAFAPVSDSNYVRVQIDVTPKQGQNSALKCKQFTVRLPASISTTLPVPFVHSPRWIGAAGGGGDKLTFVFDSIAEGGKGDTIDANGFTFGFRIDKAEGVKLMDVPIELEETSGLEGNTLETRKTTLPYMSVQVGGPEILYFMAFKDGNPCTAFQRGEKPVLQWAGLNSDSYQLLIGGAPPVDVAAGNTRHEMATGLDRDTTIVLRAGRSADQVVTYASVTVSVVNPLITASNLVVRGLNPEAPSELAIGEGWGWDGRAAIVGKPDGGGTWGPGAAYIRFTDQHAENPLPRRGTSIDFVTHMYGGGEKDALTIAGNANVGIGTKEPAARLHVAGGDTKLDGALSVSGATQLGGALTVNGGAKLDGGLTVNGGAKLGLTVTGGTRDNYGLSLRVKEETPAGGGGWFGRIACGGSNVAVVLGESGGVATIGGHNAALNEWRDLAIPCGLTVTGTTHLAGQFYFHMPSGDQGMNAWMSTRPAGTVWFSGFESQSNMIVLYRVETPGTVKRLVLQCTERR